MNVSKDGVECEFLEFISVDFFLLYDNKHYLQINLNKFAYKIVIVQIKDYVYKILFESDENQFLINGFYKTYYVFVLR